MLIGVSGKIGSGKDTIGKIIQYLVWKSRVEKGELPLSVYSFSDFARETSFGKNQSRFEIKKFADKLKDFVCMLIGCTREQLEDREFKEKELGEEWNCYIFNNGKKEELTLNYNIAKTLSADNRIISRILTPRLLLQIIGTDCIRDKVHPNAWVNALFADYKYEIHRSEVPTRAAGFIDQHVYPNWIITDMRFPNELEAVKSRGGITIRVNRIVGKRVYIISNEQPFENWYGIVESYNGNNFYNIINNVDDVILVHKNQITLQDEHESETALDNAEFDYTIENNSTIEDLIHTVSLILKREKII